VNKAKHYEALLAKHKIKKSRIARLIFPNSSSSHSSLCNWFNGQVKNPNWGLIDLFVYYILEKRKKIKNKC
jgi:hypothetical protein